MRAAAKPCPRASVLATILASLRVIAAAIALGIGALTGNAAAQTLEKLDVVTAKSTTALQVEVMRTDTERAKGLMFRRFLPDDRGMLFDFKSEAPVMMWMKNTILPLDMVFIAKDGKIVSIAENTEPMSETVIPSGGAVLSVLEVNAGTAARLGWRAGDRIVHPLFGR